MRTCAALLVMGIVLVGFPLLAADADAKPAVDAAKRADIRKLLELTGAGKMGVQVMTQMFASFRKSMPNVPEKFWVDFMKEVNPDDLVELAVPGYDKHLSHDEIKELVKFYDSDLGRKLLLVQPQIMAESMAAGQEWGKKLGEKVAKKLREEGLSKE